MITQITDLVLLIVLKIVNKLFVQKTSFPFRYPLSVELFLKILRFYRLHEACYLGFSLIRAIVLIFLLATVELVQNLCKSIVFLFKKENNKSVCNVP